MTQVARFRRVTHTTKGKGKYQSRPYLAACDVKGKGKGSYNNTCSYGPYNNTYGRPIPGQYNTQGKGKGKGKSKGTYDNNYSHNNDKGKGQKEKDVVSIAKSVEDPDTHPACVGGKDQHTTSING
eukprot:394815-Amphidinium_carterae.2